MNIQTGDEAASPTDADQLHGGARQARHPAAQQHRRDVHQPLGVGRRRTGRTRRYGVDAAFSFFQNVDARRLLRAHRDAGPRRRRRQLPGAVRLRRRSLRRARRVPEGRRQLQPGGRLRRAATTSARSFGRCASARGRQSIKAVRKFTWQGNFEYFENGAGALETRDRDRAVQHRVREQRSASRSRSTRNYELLRAAVRRSLGRDDSAPAATSSPTRWCRYAFGAQRRVSGTVSLQAGQLLRRHDHGARLQRRRASRC